MEPEAGRFQIVNELSDFSVLLIKISNDRIEFYHKNFLFHFVYVSYFSNFYRSKSFCFPPDQIQSMSEFINIKGGNTMRVIAKIIGQIAISINLLYGLLSVHGFLVARNLIQSITGIINAPRRGYTKTAATPISRSPNLGSVLE